MRRINSVLMLIILAELAVVAPFAIRRVRQARPPLPNLSRLDASTAAEARELRSRVTSDDALSWQNLGDMSLAFGFFAEAEVCYARAAEIGRPTHDLLLRWGVCLDRLGRLDLAIAKYEQAAASAAGRRRDVCFYHIARCFLRNQQVDLALENLLLAGDFELAQYELAHIQTRIGRADAAVPILDTLLRRYPDELKLNLLRARVAEQLGDADGARRFLDRAERSQDNLFLDSTVEYIGLLRVAHGLPRERARCIALEKSEQFTAAADGLQAAQRVEWNLDVARQLVRLNFRLGRIDEATAVLRQMTDRFGNSPEFLEQQGDAAFLLQRADEAAELWQRAADLRPNARQHQLLADYHARRGATEQAQLHRARMEMQLGLASYRSNQLPAAIEHLTQAVALDPQQPEAWFWLGQSQRESSDAAAAKAAYARCLEQQPHHGRALDEQTRLEEVATSPPGDRSSD